MKTPRWMVDRILQEAAVPTNRPKDPLRRLQIYESAIEDLEQRQTAIVECLSLMRAILEQERAAMRQQDEQVVAAGAERAGPVVD